jgi:urease accessory protein
MRSAARVVAEAGSDGRTRLIELAAAAPLGLRPTRDALMLVSTAQGLLDDDDLTLEVVVGPGATLVVRSAAATVAYTSRHARLTVSCSVAPGGRLDWRPEPLIATAGCHLSLEARIVLEAGAALRWTEELVLGRLHEVPGSFATSLSVDLAGLPLLRHELAVGPDAPGWDGPAIVGSHRAVGLTLFAGALATPASAAGAAWAVMELAGGGALVSAFASDIPELRLAMAEACGPVSVGTGR